MAEDPDLVSKSNSLVIYPPVSLCPLSVMRYDSFSCDLLIFVFLF